MRTDEVYRKEYTEKVRLQEIEAGNRKAGADKAHQRKKEILDARPSITKAQLTQLLENLSIGKDERTEYPDDPYATFKYSLHIYCASVAAGHPSEFKGREVYGYDGAHALSVYYVFFFCSKDIVSWARDEQLFISFLEKNGIDII